ncbi:MAG: hypothetical protein R2750_10795, partial [Bacteroidales bacterium]
TMLVTCVYASWWAPSLSASFGHRGFVDIYPILSMPLGYFVYRVFQLKNKSGFYLLSFITLLFVYLNVRMSFIYLYLWWESELGWTGYLNRLMESFFIN